MINLTNKILIASPYYMEGNMFYKSVIYIVYHNKDGCIGLMINHLMRNVLATSLFHKLNIYEKFEKFHLNVFLGGPVDLERGFFLHSDDYKKNLLFKPSGQHLAISSNLSILNDIVNGNGPKNKIFVVGYTGWTANQIETELQNNLWLISDINDELIFSNKVNHKWHLALNNIGVRETDFIPIMGTA